MFYFLLSAVFMTGILVLAKLWPTRPLPYWPCEVSRCLASSGLARVWAYVFIGTAIACELLMVKAGLPILWALLGVLGVVFFDDVNYWFLHTLSVVYVAACALFWAWSCRSQTALWVFGVAIFFKLATLGLRTFCVAVAEPQSYEMPALRRLLDFKNIAKRTREIHLTGNARCDQTLITFQIGSVAQWIGFAVLAAVFDCT